MDATWTRNRKHNRKANHHIFIQSIYILSCLAPPANVTWPSLTHSIIDSHIPPAPPLPPLPAFLLILFSLAHLNRSDNTGTVSKYINMPSEADTPDRGPGGPIYLILPMPLRQFQQNNPNILNQTTPTTPPRIQRQVYIYAHKLHKVIPTSPWSRTPLPPPLPLSFTILGSPTSGLDGEGFWVRQNSMHLRNKSSFISSYSSGGMAFRFRRLTRGGK